jgi:hypothetical protein
MMQNWNELGVVVEQVNLNEDSDSLVRCYEKSGVYSQSLYVVISFRGVTPLYMPAIWNNPQNAFFSVVTVT